MMRLFRLLDWLGLRFFYWGLVAITAVSLLPWLCAAYWEEIKAQSNWFGIPR